MAKCDVFLKLDKTRYRQPEEITGEVKVEAKEDCECKGLTLESTWKTSGLGDLCVGMGPGQKLFQGPWKAGRQYSYPFRLTIPPGPCSYDGKEIHLGWTLEAKADLPWAIDAKDEKDFWVAPGPVDNYFAGRAYRPPSKQPLTRTRDLWILGGTFVACLAFLSMLDHLIHCDVSGLRFFFELVGVLGGVFRAIYGPLMRFLAIQKTGKVSVRLDSHVLDPGEELVATVWVQSGQDILGSQVEAELVADEWVTSSSSTSQESGRSESTKTYQVYIRKAVQELSQTKKGRSRSSRNVIRMMIPPEGPLTLDTHSNSVKWFLRVRLNIPEWPDWKQEYRVVVRPSKQT